MAPVLDRADCQRDNTTIFVGYSSLDNVQDDEGVLNSGSSVIFLGEFHPDATAS